VEKLVQTQTVTALQVGFNNNVRHKGRVFHIQTEDSGIHRPHISTHLFADGGRILRSERHDYSDILGAEDFVAQLRKRMKEQHRAMFVALRQGDFDEVIDTLPGGDETSQMTVKAARPASKSRRPSRRPSVRASRPPSLSRPQHKQSVHPKAESGARVKLPSSAPVGGAVPAGRPASTSSAANPAVARPSAKSSGSHQAVRPSAASGSSASLFGSGNIHEQSLDDVILSYISEDLDSE